MHTSAVSFSNQWDAGHLELCVQRDLQALPLHEMLHALTSSKDPVGGVLVQFGLHGATDLA
eukprot:2757669-Amphidinium_carterae.2